MKRKIIISSIIMLFTVVTATLANTPTDVFSKIRKDVETKYVGAVITEIESDEGKIDVDIVHKSKEKDLIYSNSGVWQSTKYDIKKSELPEKIKTVIKDSRYSSYRIDDIEVIETPDRSMYEIELTKIFADDITIYITFDGKIL